MAKLLFRATEDHQSNRPVAGVLFCVSALLAFAIQDSIVKLLSAKYPLLAILTIRSSIVLCMLLVFGLATNGPRILTSSRPHLLLLRGVLAFIAFTCYYTALSEMPLADAAAVYMTAPLFVTILSIPILGERVGWHRFGAIFLGFAGVLFMLNPGSDVFQPLSLLPLVSAMSYAMIPIINRRIGTSQHILTMTIYTTVSYLFLCGVAFVIIHQTPASTFSNESSIMAQVFEHWYWPEWRDLLLISLTSAFFLYGLVGITQAYRIAAVSVVAPSEYSYLLWTSVLGFFVFADIPTPRVIIGSVLVVAAGCYVVFREQRQT